MSKAVKAVEARFDTPEFHTLLETLKKIVHDDNLDDEWFYAIVWGAAMLYDSIRQFPGLHDLADPLSRVIDILKNDELRDGVLILLGANPVLALLATEAIAPIVAQHERLLSDLEQMKATLAEMPTPPKRGPGNPREAKDLLFVVSKLAEQWIEVVGQPFKVHWQGYEPLTPAMQFVYEIVKFIDRTRLDELPTVTKKVRRRITVDKQFAS
jgi:hypothetical protein